MYHENNYIQFQKPGLIIGLYVTFLSFSFLLFWASIFQKVEKKTNKKWKQENPDSVLTEENF